MAKKQTKLDKMSKKERTSLAYALATNLAKHGKPQTPTNERKLTKGEEKKKEKHMSTFKKAFNLEEVQNIVQTIREQELKNPKKADLNKDGKLSSYEKTRGAAIEKAMQKEEELEEGVASKIAGAFGVLASLLAIGQINSSDPQIKALKAEYEQAQTEAEKDAIEDKITARLIYLDTGREQVNEKDEEHKILSPAELDRLAALPPTDPSFRKDRRHKRLMKKKDAKI